METILTQKSMPKERIPFGMLIQSGEFQPGMGAAGV